jgi:hypothetical protein
MCHSPCSSLAPEILPDLIARRIVVRFKPVAAADVVRVWGVALRPVAVNVARHGALPMVNFRLKLAGVPEFSWRPEALPGKRTRNHDASTDQRRGWNGSPFAFQCLERGHSISSNSARRRLGGGHHVGSTLPSAI